MLSADLRRVWRSCQLNFNWIPNDLRVAGEKCWEAEQDDKYGGIKLPSDNQGLLQSILIISAQLALGLFCIPWKYFHILQEIFLTVFYNGISSSSARWGSSRFSLFWSVSVSIVLSSEIWYWKPPAASLRLTSCSFNFIPPSQIKYQPPSDTQNTSAILVLILIFILV